jgi:hypothetical protein
MYFFWSRCQIELYFQEYLDKAPIMLKCMSEHKNARGLKSELLRRVHPKDVISPLCWIGTNQ